MWFGSAVHLCVDIGVSSGFYAAIVIIPCLKFRVVAWRPWSFLQIGVIVYRLVYICRSGIWFSFVWWSYFLAKYKGYFATIIILLWFFETRYLALVYISANCAQISYILQVPKQMYYDIIKVSFTLSRCTPRCVPAAGGPGRTGTNREGIRVRSYIPSSDTDQTRFGANNHHGLSR